MRLISDPVANQSLRVSDAVAPVLADLQELTYSVHVGEPQGFLARLEPEERLVLGEPLRDVSDEAAPIREAREWTSQLALTFTGETSGLMPLSLASTALRRATDVQPSVLRRLRGITESPRLVEIFRRHQERAVDIALLRVEASPLSAGSETPYVPEPMFPETVLRAGALYWLRVHVGARLPGSLLTERPPPLDPLLPDPPDERGHELEVVVHGQDFAVEGAARQTAYLPLLGGTKPLIFDIRAPAWDAEAVASARVAIYHRGNLLQSFLLHARVAREERHDPSDHHLRAELEFSQSQRLANLDDIGPRDFSIGANETVAGTHRLIYRSAESEADVPLTDDRVAREIDRFRTTLLDATFSDPVPEEQRFPLDGPEDWDTFDDYVRRLARDGRRLFARLLTASNPVKRILREVGRSDGKLVQVVLYNSAFSFPWAGIYDRRPPKTDEKVCLGGRTREELADGAPLEFRCGHGFNDPAFCVFGFWGVRHRLEYRLPTMGDAIRRIPPLPAGGEICLAVGAAEGYTQDLVDKLTEALPGRVKLLADEDPLELLWGPTRPAEIVLLGHLTVPEDDPDDPRIEFLGTDRSLSADSVNALLAEDDWGEPNSLVLLMACGSAASDLRSLITLHESFTSAQAGAVVGTETPVVESLVSHFAAELTSAMWRDDGRLALGDAMNEVRRALLARGNPLGFGFSAYGNADLEIGA